MRDNLSVRKRGKPGFVGIFLPAILACCNAMKIGFLRAAALSVGRVKLSEEIGTNRRDIANTHVIP